MRELAEYLVKSLVSRPEAVAIAETETPGGVVFQVSVAPEDVTRLIGKGGNTVNALRAVLHAAAASHGARVRLEVSG